MELEQVERILRKNVHKAVKIYWRDRDSDWHNYIVEELTIRDDPYDGSTIRMVELIGISQDGVEHDGVPFLSSVYEIKSVKSLSTNWDEVVKYLMTKAGYDSENKSK